MRGIILTLVSVWLVLIASTTNAIPAPDTPQTRILLRAVEPTYIQIRDTTGQTSKSILVANVFNIGDTYAVPDRPGLVMQTGNAGGVEVTVDGRVLGVLGKSGQVMTRIPLDPTFLTERITWSQ